MIDIDITASPVTLVSADVSRTVTIVENAGNTNLQITSPKRRSVKRGKRTTFQNADAQAAVIGSWLAAGLGDALFGGAIVTEHPGDATESGPVKHTQAYRAKAQAGQTRWGMFWKREVGTSIKVIRPEVRLDKGNRTDTKGFVTLVAVKSVSPSMPEDVLFFGGVSWNDGVEQSVTVLSTMEYDLTLDDGEFPYVASTGETVSESIPETADDADGNTHTVEAGDVLFYYSNERVDNDQASITAMIEVWT